MFDRELEGRVADVMPKFIAIIRYVDLESGDAECVEIIHDSDNMRLWDRVDDFCRDRRKGMIEAEYYHRAGGNYMKGA